MGTDSREAAFPDALSDLDGVLYCRRSAAQSETIATIVRRAEDICGPRTKKAILTPSLDVLQDLQGAHRKRVVLAYHEISELPSSDIYQIKPAQFRAHVIAALSAAHQHCVELEFTFDDAHCSHLSIAAPLLEDSGIRGKFFVPTAWVGKRKSVASWIDLRSLVDRGHSIGSHGNTHALFTGCSPEALKDELIQSRLELEDKLGIAVRTISAPGGRWNRTVAIACRAAGYNQMYTSKPSAATPTCQMPSTQLTMCGRLAVRRQTSVKTLVKYIAGNPLVCSSMLLQFQARYALKRLLGDQTYQAMWRHAFRSPSGPRHDFTS